MTPIAGKRLLMTILLSVFGTAAVLAQDSGAGSENPQAKLSAEASFAKSLNKEQNWYFSWGYSRQQYAPSDIHISQPSEGNDFTLHQVAASDFPASVSDTIKSLTEFEFTGPQENVRIGKFMNPEKTFAIEFSLDHSKYNTDLNQTAAPKRASPTTKTSRSPSRTFTTPCTTA